MDDIEFPCQLEIPEGTFEITPDDRGFSNVFKVHETVPVEQAGWGYAQPERGRLMFRIVVDPRKGLDPVSEAMTQLEKKLAAPKDLDMVEKIRWRYRKINQICAETAEHERLATRLTDAEQQAAHLAKQGQPMPKHPFEALQDHHLKWVAQGIGSDHGTLVGDSRTAFLHPGDDAGRAAAVAFEKYGPDVAADILRCYRAAYNRAIMAANASHAASDAVGALSEEELRETCGMALSIRLDDAQIDAVKKSLSKHPSTQ